MHYPSLFDFRTYQFVQEREPLEEEEEKELSEDYTTTTDNTPAPPSRVYVKILWI